MKYRALGKTNLQVSEIGFGCAALSSQGGGYGFGKVSERDSEDCLNMAYERGINLYDTAPIYGFGESERRLSGFIKNIREKIILVTKGGITWDSNKRVNLCNDPAVIEKMFEKSLNDLKTDYVDIYMIHWPDKEVDIRRPLEVLYKFQCEKKIKYIGLCNTNLDDLYKSKDVCDVTVVQNQLNLLQSSVVHEIFSYLKQNNIGFMSWGTLDKGILSGTVTEKRLLKHQFDKCDARSHAPWWKKSDVIKKLHKIKPVQDYLKNIRHSLLELSLTFNLSFEELSTSLCGCKNTSQLKSLLDGYENLLSEEEFLSALSLLQDE